LGGVVAFHDSKKDFIKKYFEPLRNSRSLNNEDASIGVQYRQNQIS